MNNAAIVFLVSIACFLDTISSQDCQPPKQYTDCGSACPLTCNRSEDAVCILLCVSGCFCPSGTVLHQQQCITPNRCPRAKACLPPMIYTTCGSPCPRTCDNPAPVCAAVCEEGCFCPSGTVRYLGRCLNPTECPTETSTPSLSTTTTSSSWMLFVLSYASFVVM